MRGIRGCQSFRMTPGEIFGARIYYRLARHSGLDRHWARTIYVEGLWGGYLIKDRHISESRHLMQQLGAKR